MRLTEQEISGIIDAIEQHLPVKNGELRLHGSRADKVKKGGDIDLLLVVANAELKKDLADNKHKILYQMKQNIGERKIDLLICETQDIEHDPFVSLVYPSSIILKKWANASRSK
jgi:hypothetical protein